MKQLLNYILESMLGSSENFEIEEAIEEKFGRNYKVYVIKAKPEFIGLIVGKGGSTINSIRTILKIKAVKANEFVDVKVEELIVSTPTD